MLRSLIFTLGCLLWLSLGYSAITDNCSPYGPANDNATISWDSVPGAVSYNVYVSGTPLDQLDLGVDAQLLTLRPTTKLSFNYKNLREWLRIIADPNQDSYYLYVTSINGGSVESPDPTAPGMSAVRIEVTPGPNYEYNPNFVRLDPKNSMATALEYTMYRVDTDAIVDVIESGVDPLFPGFEYQSFLPAGSTEVYTRGTTGSGSTEISCVSPPYNAFVPRPESEREPYTPFDTQNIYAQTDVTTLVNWKPGQGSTSYVVYVSAQDVTDLTTVPIAIFEDGYEKLYYDYDRLREILPSKFQANGVVPIDSPSYYFYIRGRDPLLGPPLTAFTDAQKAQVFPGPSPLSDNGVDTLSWSAISGAAEYLVYVAPSAGTSPTSRLPVFAASTGTSTSFDYSGLLDIDKAILAGPVRFAVAVGDGNGNPVSAFSYIGIDPAIPGILEGVIKVEDACNIGGGPVVSWEPAGFATSYNLYISDEFGGSFQALASDVQSLFYFTGKIRKEIADAGGLLSSELQNYIIYVQSVRGTSTVPATATGPGDFSGVDGVDQKGINPSVDITDDPANTMLTWPDITGYSSYDLYFFGETSPFAVGVPSPYNYFDLVQPAGAIQTLVIGPNPSGSCPSQYVSIYAPPASNIINECSPSASPDPRITWDASPGASAGYLLVASNGSAGVLVGGLSPGVDSEVLPDGSGVPLTTLEYNYVEEPAFGNRSLRTILTDIGGVAVDPLEPEFFLYVFSTDGSIIKPVFAPETVAILIAPGPDLTLGSGSTVDWLDLQSTTGPNPITVTDYIITYSGPLSGTTSVPSPGSSGSGVSWDYTSDLTTPGTYQVEVQWSDGSNSSCRSTIQVVVPVTPPGLVSNLENECNPPTRQITWNAGPGATSYNIYVSESQVDPVTTGPSGNADLLTPSPITALSYDYTNIRTLIAGLSSPNVSQYAPIYYLYVQSVDGINPSHPMLGAAGDWPSVRIEIRPAPIWTQINPTTGQLTLLSNPGVSSYTISIGPPLNQSLSIPQPSPLIPNYFFDLSGAATGTYDITVDWVDDLGVHSCPSDPISFTVPPTDPGLVSNLQDTCSPPAREITWDPASGTGATNYNLFIADAQFDPIDSTTNADLLTTITLPATLSYDYTNIRSFGGFSNATATSASYYIYVQTEDSTGPTLQPEEAVAGGWPLVEVRIDPGPVIADVSPNIQIGTLTGAVTEYVITYTEVAPGTNTGTVSLLQPSPYATPLLWDYTGLPAGTYDVTVSWTDGVITSCPSNEVQITVAPTIPSLVTNIQEECSLITWDAADDADGYNVYISETPLNPVTLASAHQLVTFSPNLSYSYTNVRNAVAAPVSATAAVYYIYIQSEVVILGSPARNPVLGVAGGWPTVQVEVRPGMEIIDNAGLLQVEWPTITGATSYTISYTGTSSGSETGSSSPWYYGDKSPGTYDVTVTYDDGIAQSCPSNTVTVTVPQTPPGLASNLQNSCLSSLTDPPKITWDAGAGAIEYNIYASDIPLDPVTLSTPLVDTIILPAALEYDYSTVRIDSGFSSSGPIYLYVQSVDGINPDQPVLNVVGDWPLVEIKVVPPITIADDSLNNQVTWGTFTNVATYDISYMGTSPGAPTGTASKGSSPWDYTSLPAGTYDVTVNVVATGIPTVISCDSNIVSITVPEPPPGLVTDLMNDCSPPTKEITWNAGSGAVEYNLYISNTQVDPVELGLLGNSDLLTPSPITALSYDYTNIRSFGGFSNASSTDGIYYVYVQSISSAPLTNPELGVAGGWPFVEVEIRPGPVVTNNGGSTRLEWPALNGATGGYTVSYAGPSPGTVLVSQPSSLPATVVWEYGNGSVSPAGVYTATVTWTDGTTSCPSESVSFTVPDFPPGLVTNLNNDCSPPTKEITWNAASGAVEYNLYISNAQVDPVEIGLLGNSDLLTPSPITALSYDYTNIRSFGGFSNASSTDGIYYLYVQSVSSASLTNPELGVPGDWPSVREEIRPGPVVTDSSPQLQWPALNGATGGYLVTYSGASSGTIHVPQPASLPATVSWNYTGLTTGVHTATVTWSDGSTISCPSESIAFTAPPVVPGLISNLVDNCPPTKNITWTAGSGATGYNLYASNTSIPPNPVSLGNTYQLNTTPIIGTTYDYTNIRNFGGFTPPLKRSKSYYLYVQSVDGVNPNQPVLGSSVGWPTVEIEIKPGPVIALNILTNQIEWPSLDGVTEYIVTYSGTSSGSVTIPQPTTTPSTVVWNYTGLTQGAHTVTVSWSDDGGLSESCPSNEIAFTAPPTNPGLVSNLQDNCSPPTKEITWGAGVGASFYNIYVSENEVDPVDITTNADVLGSTSLLSFEYADIRSTVGPIVSAVSPIYYLYVQSAGGINPNYPVLSVAGGWPTVRVEIKPGPQISDNAGLLQVDWPALTGITEYLVTYSGTTSSGTETVFAGVWDYSGFSPGTYTVSVSWVNGNDISCPSNEITIIIPDNTPGLITSLNDLCSADPADSSKITWDAGPGAIEYDIYASDESQDPVSLANSVHLETISSLPLEYDYSTVRMDSGFTNSASIFLYVRASDGVNTQPELDVAGGWSSVEIEVVPPIVITDDSANQQVTWGTFTGVSLYEITYTGLTTGLPMATIYRTASSWDYGTSGLPVGEYSVIVNIITDGTPSLTSCDSNALTIRVDPGSLVQNPENLDILSARALQVWLQEDVEGAYYLRWDPPASQTGILYYNIYHSTSPTGTPRTLIRSSSTPYYYIAPGLLTPLSPTGYGYLVVTTVTSIGESSGAIAPYSP